VYTSTTHTRYK